MVVIIKQILKDTVPTLTEEQVARLQILEHRGINLSAVIVIKYGRSATRIGPNEMSD